jgi:divinyl chlorophyllide a 8-vinyl-reductase
MTTEPGSEGLHERLRGRRVLLLGASGTIGRAALGALRARGARVTCLVRPGRRSEGQGPPGLLGPDAQGCDLVSADVCDPRAFEARGAGAIALAGQDAVVSCMASRTGVPRDAWAVDYQAHQHVLAAAQQAGVRHFILLSAICVQKPRLAFQHAKLAFERSLIDSGLTYSIVRPTAFFKSLSGQIARVRRGAPFLVFGDGTLTACKPISDGDLAAYLADCLTDERQWNRILPIGGPGPAITPLDQGRCLFELLGRKPRFRHVPVRMLDLIAGGLAALARIAPAAAVKAELARIGRYYATESMLYLDPRTGRYDADATPSTGTQTLFDFYQSVLAGASGPDRGDHAVF